MRSNTRINGPLLAVAGFAFAVSGSARAAQGVQVAMPDQTWHAEYVFDPGANDEAHQSVDVTRKLKFFFADAKIDPSNPKAIAPESDDNIREYLSSDVVEALKSAQAEAAASNKKIESVLPKYLAQLRFKTVDCRQVARDMVETLISSRVKSKLEKDNTDSLRYVRDEDQMDVAMTAKQLDSVTIMRDPSIGATDIEPRYTCRETSVGGTTAGCGDLRLKFNPLEATGGVFKGQKAVVFDADGCKNYPDMDFNACELLVQVQRCGLRYSEKADGKRSTNPSTRGLADLLEEKRDADLHAYEAGTGDVAKPDASGEAPDTSASSFMSGFHLPSDPAASRPAE